MKAPFVWFGGKSRCATEVWEALGDCDNYVEPFAGSLAVLLLRPGGAGPCETVNDADHYLANFWRALAADPQQVAHFADWPVNESDLFARHLWLVKEGRERIARMESDPEFFDAKVAGWWVWGINSWIGSGWCAGNGPHRQLPYLGSAGQGVNRQLPHLGSAGQGVNQPDGPEAFTFGGSGKPRNPWPRKHERPALYEYFDHLAARLRRVRVCCGDWSRVITDGALTHGTTKGIFLDPPYLGDVRTKDLYRVDDHEIAHEVSEWAIKNGDRPDYRIVLAGYEMEHAGKFPDGWTMIHGKGGSGFIGANKKNENRKLERLWLSPHCLKPAGLFAEAAS